MKMKIPASLIPAAAMLAIAAAGGPARAAAPAARQEVLGLERAFVEVADRVGPAVVSIAATYTIVHRFSPWGDEMYDEFFRQFFEVPQYEQREPVISAGSGVIVSIDGYILTNAHVIGKAKNVSVKLLNKQEYKARIMGVDEDTDIAVLKIATDRPLTAAALGDSDAIRVGQWAIAIGNPFGLENTMTVGVISAKGRRLDDSSGGRPARFTSFIQTDASINRGNSGGPLINIRGEVIGINSMIFSPSGGSVGIGFAIPVNLARTVMDGLIKEGKIVRPQLGIAYGPVPPEVAKKLKLPGGQGMAVSAVLKGTAAERAGLKPGDVVLSVDKKPVKEVDDLRTTVLQHKVGDTIALEVYRRGQRLSLDVVLKEQRPEAAPAAGAPKGGGKAPGERKTWLGMGVEELSDELAQQLGARDAEGVIVVRVDPDTPAADSGVQRGDVIREVEQQPVRALKEFDDARKRVGDKESVLLLVERRGSTMYIVVERQAKSGGD